MGNKATTELPYVVSLASNDDIIVNANGQTARIRFANFNNNSNDWDSLLNKPFSTYDNNYFKTSYGVLSLSDRLLSQIHTHNNKSVLDKITEDENGNILYNFNPISGTSFDFTSLSDAFTNGNLSGIMITPNNSNETFDITITGIPEITIDSDGYWNINGERGDNPTLAKGEKGDTGENGQDGVNGQDGIDGQDGISPTINIVATENGNTVTITDKDGSQSFDILNGTNGTNGEDGITTIVATSVNLTGILLAADWSASAPYTQSITINGLMDSTPILDVILSDETELAEKEDTEWSYISKAITSENLLTVTCLKKKPTVDLNIQLKVV